jgi:hypothetical protein
MPPATQGPVDSGDDGFVDFGIAQHRIHGVAELATVDLIDTAAGNLLLQFGHLRNECLEIGARHEVAPYPGDDRHPGVVVGVELAPRVCKIPKMVDVAGVPGLRPVDGDDNDMLVVLCIMNRHDLSCRWCVVQSASISNGSPCGGQGVGSIWERTL